MADLYKQEVVDPGDRASAFAGEVCVGSYNNSQAVRIIPHQPHNFRGPVGYLWAPNILNDLRSYNMNPDGTLDWKVLEEVENDGAGGKPQFFSLLGEPAVFYDLGWEIITMVADDFARTGRLPVIMSNEIQVKAITEANFELVQAMLTGYAEALEKAKLVNITGEIAIMKHSITSFCDQNDPRQLILTWGGNCIGLARKEKMLDPANIRPGMTVVGYKEKGYRCNGGTFFTNLLLAAFGNDIGAIRKNPEAMRLVRALTVPSQSYARHINRVHGWRDNGSAGDALAEIIAVAHITGGGVWGKFGEILPKGIGAELISLPEPALLLREAQDMSWDFPDLRLSDEQAYGTLHGGCGMLIVVKTKKDAEILIEEASRDGIEAQIVGYTNSSGSLSIQSRFREGKYLTKRL